MSNKIINQAKDAIKFWLLYLFFKILAIFPLVLLRALGSVIGDLFLYFASRARQRLYNNLLRTQIANNDNIQQLARQTAREFGKGLVETVAIAWQRSKFYNSKLILKVSNYAAIEKALANPTQAILLLTPHIGNFEIALKFFAFHSPRQLTILYKPSKQVFFNKLMIKGRSEDNIVPVAISRSGINSVIKAIRNKEIVGILPDSVASSGDGVFVKFFNQDVFATTLAAKLAQYANVQTFIVNSSRIKNGFALEFIPYTVKTDKIEIITQELYDIFAGFIVKNPSQYYWSYDRFRQPKHAITKN